VELRPFGATLPEPVPSLQGAPVTSGYYRRPRRRKPWSSIHTQHDSQPGRFWSVAWALSGYPDRRFDQQVARRAFAAINWYGFPLCPSWL